MNSFKIVHLLVLYATILVHGLGFTVLTIPAIRNASMSLPLPLTETQSPEYSIINSQLCPASAFSVDPSAGNLIVSSSLQVAYGGRASTCAPNGSSDYQQIVGLYHCLIVVGRNRTLPVIINVLPSFFPCDVNLPALYAASAKEGVSNAPVSVPATPSRWARPSYRIVPAGRFSLRQTTIRCESFPEVFTFQPLNKTQRAVEQFTLEASLDAGTSCVSSTNVSVRVVGTNSYSPVFTTRAGSVVHVREDVALGTEIARFSAVDMDEGLNKRVVFRLASALRSFILNYFTGALTVAFPLDYETTPRPLNISVVVSDLGYPPRSAQTQLTIFIDDANELAPVIHVLNANAVSEKARPGAVVLTVRVNDQDSTDVDIKLTTFDCNCFLLSGDLGGHVYNVTVNGNLDYESFPKGYAISLVALDNGQPVLTSSVDLQVVVLDENEEPTFPQSSYTSKIVEEVPIGTALTPIVTAIDPDTGTYHELGYSIQSSNPWFTIHGKTGVISTSSRIDYEMNITSTMTIQVQNVGGLHSSAIVTAAIMDINDNKPVFPVREYAFTIPESVSIDASIFNFSALDRDSLCNGAVEYTILYAEPEAFEVDSVSGLVFPLTSRSIDFESFQTARLLIQARDLGSNGDSNIATALLTLNITNVDDEPPVIDPFNCPCWIMENRLAISCPSINAHDPDSSNLTFSIETGNGMRRFTIGSSTGVVTNVVSLDREEQANYTLGIVASDGRQKSDIVQLWIVVLDENDSPPEYPGGSSTTIVAPQDLVTGDVVGVVAAEHRDAGYNGITLYRFSPDTPVSITNALYLNPLSGELRKSGSLSLGTFTFSIIAMDLLRSNQSASISVSLTIRGFKNHPPVFLVSMERVAIADNLRVGSAILSVMATDIDSGSNAQLTYRLVTNTSVFNVSSSGLVTLAYSVTNSAQSTFVLNVSVTDGGATPMTAHQLVMVTVYSSTIMVGGVSLYQNPATSVCHVVGTVVEKDSGGSLVTTLSSMQGGNTIIYSILTSNLSDAFVLNGNSVRTTMGHSSVFDRTQMEAIYLMLRAQYLTNFHLCTVTIAVSDINDHGPVFLDSPVKVEVYAGLPSRSPIVQLKVTDQDVGSNAQTMFSLVNSSSPIFSVDAVLGYVLLSSAQQIQGQHTVSVRAYDALSSSLNSTTEVIVTIIPTVNTPPLIVPQKPPVVSSPETVAINSLIFNFSLTDADLGVEGLNRFCIASGNSFGFFQVQPSGLLTNVVPLDYELRQDPIFLTMAAYDQSPNVAFVTTTIQVNITDQNDGYPAFRTSIYRTWVSEDAAIGTQVFAIQAYNRDSGPNGHVRYSILGNVPFNISSTMGTMTTTASLDRETVPVWYLNVTAVDNTRVGRIIGSSVLVEVHILDINDNTPTLGQVAQTLRFPESTEVGTEVYHLSGSDQDAGMNALLAFYITGGNSNSTFVIDPLSGSIQLARKLDYEMDPTAYTLTLSVSDFGMPKLTSTVVTPITFQLQDVNDNYPVFSSKTYNCSIIEGVFSPPCFVKATDADKTGADIRYIISDTGTPLFSINSNSGLLQKTDALNLGKSGTYPVTITASDSGSPRLAASTLVFVTVTATRNVLPVFEDTLLLKIPENLPVNAIAFLVHAWDPSLRVSSAITYNEHNDTSNTNRLHVDDNTGAVYVTGVLDYELASGSWPSIFIVAISSYTYASTLPKQYAVTILDVDENTMAPMFTVGSPKGVLVFNDMPVGSVVANVTATDDDPGPDGQVKYALVGGSGYGYFRVDGSTGAVVTAFPLTSFGQSKFVLYISARDNGSYPMESLHQLTIVLAGNTRAKPFLASPVIEATAMEGSGNVGSIVTMVTAYVADYIDTNVTYTITSGDPDGRFQISSSSGVLSTRLSLNLQQQKVHSLVVTASHGLSASKMDTSSGLIVVNVMDENERPIFSSINYTVFVFENFPVNQTRPFMRAFATDFDQGSNGKIVYSISAGPPFGIDPARGHLYLISPLNISLSHVHNFVLTATDQGFPPYVTSTSVSVFVLPSPSSSQRPTCSETVSVPLSEEAPVGSVAATYTAIDMDSTSLMYWIVPVPEVPFTIHPNTGVIYVTSSLDRETTSIHLLMISVTDGVSTITCQLSITVTDVNDNRPQFEALDLSFSVAEAIAVGTPIGTVRATDSDVGSNGNLTFSLNDAANPLSLDIFEISAAGSLRVKGEIDRENVSVHTITVVVTDRGATPLSNFARVTVWVTDINDHVPQFILPLPHIIVKEDAAVGTVVFTINAFDPDYGTNATVLFQMGLLSGVPFALNASTGELLLTNHLDYESRSTYDIVVTAFNPGNSHVNTTAVFHLDVVDMLDSAPVISGPSSAAVSENLEPYLFVAQFTSMSRRSVTYSITGGDPAGHFLIEPATGVLRTAVSLDRENNSSYLITVRGWYSNEYFNNTSIVVQVMDVNDVQPTFTSSFITISIPEDAPLGASLYHFDVSDSDIGTNGMVSAMEILDTTAAQYFSVSSAGDLSIHRHLDRLNSFSSIKFDLYAFDGGVTRLYSKVKMTILVQNTANHPPVFTLARYYFELSAPVLASRPVLRVEATDLDQNQLRYTLAGGNGTGRFELNRFSGDISVADNYNLTGEYHLVVNVTDGGGLQDTAMVVVDVKRCGFAGLALHPRSLTLEIGENNAANASLPHPIRLFDFGRPAGSGFLEYIVSGAAADRLFSVSASDGALFVASSLDREQQAIHTFALQVVDRVGPSISRLAQADVRVVVKDENDNTPQFTNAPPYISYVPNTAGIGSAVVRVSAVDSDEGTNARVTFSLTANPYDTFSIDPSSGLITVARSLTNPLLGSSAVIVVVATDGGTPVALSTQTVVNVGITNPDAPRFSASLYSVTVPESIRSRQIIANVSASSSTPGSSLYYDISGNTPLIPFSIGTYDGMVTVNDLLLDYEVTRFYRLTLRAISNALVGLSLLEVTVQDVNDNAPQFTKPLYLATVVENYIPQAALLSVGASDADSPSNARITYELERGDVVGQTFQIDPATGIITLLLPLDFERSAQYQFTVLAVDSGDPRLTGSAVVRVGVQNANDNPPVFDVAVYSAVLQERAPARSRVVYVRATDVDGDVVRYSVAGGGNQYFAVDDYGLVTSTRDLTNLTSYRFDLNVSASDGVHYGYCTVVIEVTPVNDNSPAFRQAVWTGQVVENSLRGTPVLAVLATDPDRGTFGQVSYISTSNDFPVDPNNGTVFVNGTVDRERTATVTFTVFAQDGGRRSAASVVILTVLDANDNAPTFDPTSISYVADGTSSGTPVFTLRAHDPDLGSNGTVVYSLCSVTTDFSVDPQTGVISTVGFLYASVRPQYVLCVRCMDNGSPPLTSADKNITILLYLQDVGGPRLGNSSYNVSVPDNVTFGTAVLTVNYQAGDCSNEPRFEASGTDVFITDGMNRVLTRVLRLVRSASPYFFELVLSCDVLDVNSMATLRRESRATVTVSLIYTNQAPSFSLRQFLGSVSENQAAYTTVVPNPLTPAIAATDPDTGPDGVVAYFIVVYPQSTPVPFGINATSGVVFTTAALDRERIANYTFRVSARDSGSPPLASSVYVTVTIFVNDENDSPPEFSQSIYYAAISEDAPNSTSVVTLVAKDLDSPANARIRYSMSISDQFAIDPATGVVSTTAPLDRETTASYMFEVQATDGTFWDATMVVINITDVDDNPPIFQSPTYETTVNENYPVAVPFLTVVATDQDEGTNKDFIYEVENGKGVTIDPSNGTISFLASPDYEYLQKLEFITYARGSGIPSDRSNSKVTVNIRDVNDNAPDFSSASYSASVVENSPIKTIVSIVFAIDRDSGSNGFVTYETHGEAAAWFDVHSQSGVVTTSGYIDRESNASFALSVVASDHGKVNLSSTCQVLVTVLDSNDNAPQFAKPSFELQVSETVSPGHVIFNGRATDADAGSNAEVSYVLQNGTDKFALVHNYNNDTVSVTVVQKLNARATAFYRLVLEGIDNGVPHLRGSTSLLIKVLDANNNPPTFTLPYYQAEWSESTPIGTTLYSLRASDLDPTDNGNLLYSIQDAPLYPEIAINESTGDIVVAYRLDYETIRMYSLRVLARDRRLMDSLTGTTTINITILDYNDNRPVFSPPNQTLSLYENNSPGGTLTQMVISDRDTLTPVEQATFSIASGDDGHNFSVTADSGIITVVRSLDREAVAHLMDQVILVVAANDNGDPSLIGTSYITVVVMDQNDNPPVGVGQDVFINVYNDTVGVTSFGQLVVQDPDEVNNYVYSIISGASHEALFAVGPASGVLTLVTHFPPEGQYTVSVRVTDTTIYGQFSTITTPRITIRKVSSRTLRNSIILLAEYAAGSIAQFIDGGLVTFLVRLVDLFGSQQQRAEDKTITIHLFAVEPWVGVENGMELHLAVALSDGRYLHPTLVQHLVHTNVATLSASTGVTVMGVDVDLCIPEPCDLGAVCDRVTTYSLGSSTRGSSYVKFLGIVPYTLAACKPYLPPCISCTEPGFCLLDEGDGGTSSCIAGCSPNPCRRDGVCVSQLPAGYYCVCGDGYTGRNCELTTATFVGTSYAMFPAIKQRINVTISLDIMAAEKHGLLLYSGRFDDNAKDYVAVGIEGGLVYLSTSYGGAETTLKVAAAELNNHIWHTIFVWLQESSATLTVRTLDPYSRLSSNSSLNEDYHSLDLGAPLFVGGIPPNFNYALPPAISFVPFVGCIRALRVNGNLMDFGSPLLASNVTNGCSYTDGHCKPNPCKNGGDCIGSWSTSSCQCKPRYSGSTCTNNAKSASFSGKEFIQYTVLTSSNNQQLLQKAQTTIYMNLLTTSLSGTVMVLGDTSSSEFAILEVSEGYIQFRYNLGSDKVIVQQRTVPINDGEFHHISLHLVEQEVELVVDNRYIARNSSRGLEGTLDVPPTSIYVGAIVDPNGVISGAFKGCVWGVYLDQHALLEGESSSSFTAKPYPSTLPICPEVIQILGPDESPKSALVVYSVLAVSLFVVFVISVLSTITCSFINHCRRKTKCLIVTANDLAFPSRNGISNHQFQYDIQLVQRLPPPPPMSSASSQTWSEATFTFNNPKVGGLDSQDSMATNSPQRSSQKHPTSALVQSVQLTRSPSCAQSILTVTSATTDKADSLSAAHDDVEIEKFVKKQVEMANDTVEDQCFDKPLLFSVEGKYEPMGSIGSLYDIVSDSSDVTRTLVIPPQPRQPCDTTQHSVNQSERKPKDKQKKDPARPHEVPAGPHGVPAGPRRVPAGPHGVPAGPHGVPAGPRGVPAGPHGVPAGPHGVPARPHGVPAGPHGVPAGPHGVPAGPHGVPAGPHGVPARPHGVLAGPQRELDRPQGELIRPQSSLDGFQGGETHMHPYNSQGQHDNSKHSQQHSSSRKTANSVGKQIAATSEKDLAAVDEQRPFRSTKQLAVSDKHLVDDSRQYPKKHLSSSEKRLAGSNQLFPPLGSRPSDARLTPLEERLERTLDGFRELTSRYSSRDADDLYDSRLI